MERNLTINAFLIIYIKYHMLLVKIKRNKFTKYWKQYNQQNCHMCELINYILTR